MCGIIIVAVFNLKPVFWFIDSLVLGYGICERDRQRERQTDRDIETQREGGRHRERESLCVTSEESAVCLGEISPVVNDNVHLHSTHQYFVIFVCFNFFTFSFLFFSSLKKRSKYNVCIHCKLLLKSF